MATLLWTRDKRGKIQGFLTHQTAEALQQGTLTSDQPIQIGVPKGFRRSTSVPDGISLTFVPKGEHKTLKLDGLWLQDSTEPPSVNPQRDMDAPDYYDWLDYQAVLCAQKT